MRKLSQKLLEVWIKIPRSVRIFVLNIITIFFFLHLLIAGLKSLFELSIELPVLLIAIIVSFLVMMIISKNN
ncbi:hypothetical protein SAMN04487943_102409 [Gracilibacillus orientalis]|uniref:Uncharacterized protein n=1 Tax=Gracilibacillus orientalis TaxID=334253 RepID=A0A1I4J1C1_9BACI|nr:hypothetical protein [Gracilibacillus orientalis]SFL60320.1 hypothetical protein SAMN04487943_102409 [Gracilibacillus orientalis]